MEDDVRLALEGFIDKFIKDTENQLQIIVTFLCNLGIEPNLEIILSYISGSAWGQFHMHYQALEIEVTPKLLNEFTEIMEGRFLVLRETFIRTLHK